MHIVHYSLGFPPFRTGGMTTYCTDLIAEQIRQGNGVCLLWPGRLTGFGVSCAIRRKNPYTTALGDSMASYELVNPLPVPLLNGIRDISLFTASKDKGTFRRFFRTMRTDVFHVHTLQGLPVEALEVCRELGVRTVFTTHDFFGICPTVSLKNHGGPCVDDHHCSDCYRCNHEALTRTNLMLIQSDAYRRLKDSLFIRRMRRANNNKIGGSEPEEETVPDMDGLGVAHAVEYQSLRAYYMRMFGLFDLVLGNSSLTLKTFLRYVKPRNSRVLNVTHQAVTDRRSLHVAHEILQIGYLGPRMDSKGYFMLRNACDVVAGVHPGTFQLKVFFRQGEGERDYLVSGDPYTYDDLSEVMDGLDVLVVPSTRFETFGFTALEGMSFGVPVIVSASAGAADLVENGCNGMVVEPTIQALAEAIERFVERPETVAEISSVICRSFHVLTMREHAENLEGIYLELIDEGHERSYKC